VLPKSRNKHCKSYTSINVNGTARLRDLTGLNNPPTSIPTGTIPNMQESKNFPNVVGNRIDGTLKAVLSQK